MFEIFLWIGVGFATGIVFASFFEWALHRYIMHRPVKFFRYPFDTHTMIHHRVFKADATYHLQKEEDKADIPMAWWNGPVIIAMCLLPFVPIAWLCGQWWLLLGAFLAFVAYYGTYEYLHWCMHLPKARRVEKPWIFRRLNGHHLLHHRYMSKNFNVVLPLADLLLGTLIVRAKTRFAQATGPAVPDVQPLADGT